MPKPISDLVEVITPEELGGESITVIACADIAAIVINTKAQTAFVRLTNDRRIRCTNPGFVRDAWRVWKARQRVKVTVGELSVEQGDRAFLDRAFDAFDTAIKKIFG
jgi:hypothetical protein